MALTPVRLIKRWTVVRAVTWDGVMADLVALAPNFAATVTQNPDGSITFTDASSKTEIRCAVGDVLMMDLNNNVTAMTAAQAQYLYEVYSP